MLFLFLSFFASPAQAQTADERFLDGLRERRLFSLAEAYCEERLQRTDLSPQRRADLALELSRTYVEHALNSTPADREPRWQQAFSVPDTFLRTDPDNPRAILVRVQLGLAHLAKGELARQEAELVADAAPRLDEAREQLRQAVQQLQAVTTEIAVQMRKPAGGASGALSLGELQALQRNVNYQLARAYRNQGQSYPHGSPDRAGALGQAVELLGPLAESELVDSLAWQSRIDDIVCYRLLQDPAAAIRRLAALARQEPPVWVVLRARAEQVRLLLDQNRFDQALAIVEGGRTIEGQTSSDLDYAAVEAYVAAARAKADAGDKEAAAAWQAKAADMVRFIEREHGPYWSRRAEMLLAGSVASSPATSDMAVVIQAAEGFYRAGNIDEAIARYDQARELAQKSHQPQHAFDAAFTAAAIEQKRGRHVEAAKRFRQLSLDQPKLPRAAEAHLLAIFNQAQTLSGSPPAALEEYARWLEEQLTNWPGELVTNQARLWLGRMREQQQAWPAAIAAYSGVSPEYPQFSAAVEALARCQIAALNELRARNQPTAGPATTAARWFENVVTRSTNQLPERWRPVDRVAGLAAARIWLDYTGDGFARAEQILNAALAGATDVADDESFPAWKQQAQGLLAYALAGQGRRQEAANLLKQLSGQDANQALTLLEGFTRLAQTAAPEVRRELAELSLETARAQQQQPGQGLTPEGRRRLDLLVAQALDATGQTAEALRSLESLAKANPQDGAIQEEYARLLLVSGQDAPSWNAALAKWRELEQKSRSGTDRWFRAKYYLALAHQRLGNRQRAAEIINLTQVLHPDLGGPELKPKFLELLKRCQ